jgi:TolB-like protein/Flp pilus assembly protein TadD
LIFEAMSDAPAYQRFFADLKRRRVFRVMAVYGAVSFAVIEAADVILPRMSLPDWTVTLVVWLLVLGFPLTIVLAWAFERTPTGLRRTGEADARELEDIAAQPAGKRWPAGLLALGGTALFMAAAAGWFTGRQTVPRPAVTDPDTRRSIAVLPFHNLSGDDEAQPLTDGLHDDLLTQLSKIGSLKVISRTSVLEYRDTDKNVREIARELGVESVLEGGVQSAGEQFRLNVQLIDGGTDEHLWAEQYGGELTVGNILDTQAEIARQITAALEARLSPEEQADIARRPTEDVEAYEAYLRGLNFWQSGYAESNLRSAGGMAALAVERDSTFAEAWALKSMISGELFWFYYDRSDSIREASLQEARRALELEPDLALGHQAMAAYHYRFHLDYDRALESIDRILELRPTTADIEGLWAAILRRKGDTEAALEHFKRGATVDPRNFSVMAEVGETAYLLRRHDEANEWLNRAVNLKPDAVVAYTYLAANRLRAEGDTAGARDWLEQARTAGVYVAEQDMFTLIDVALAANQPDRAIAESELLSGPIDNQFFYMPPTLVRGFAWRLKDDLGRAAAAFDSARIELEDAVKANPAEPRLRSALGLAYAGLGRKSDALREGREGARLMPPEKEAWRGSWRVFQLARIEAMVGETNAAIENLEYLLSIPFDLTVAELRIDPAWDSLRSDPRFEALVEP